MNCGSDTVNHLLGWRSLRDDRRQPAGKTASLILLWYSEIQYLTCFRHELKKTVVFDVIYVDDL